ncbi:hypothetical protein DWB77_07335 [Streptomyces hundungensis]|uniref:Uncharacterized protein n=1 Tax=Streptomyces hundungensis TaxID=1077946 RepID=A0A387HNJ1_9ACTN|nr:hypothetical protein DWB77_07335 [Streptomyces hundungensis]
MSGGGRKQSPRSGRGPESWQVLVIAGGSRFGVPGEFFVPARKGPAFRSDLSVRRLYCENSACGKVTFAEQSEG